MPLLALTLSRLYEDYAGSEDAVTVDRYEAMGGMRRVVQNEIDNLLSADPAERSEQLSRLHDAFIPWLATVNSDTDQPMRRIARWADLPEHSHALLNAFVGRRLLVKGERDGQIVVEVALESLLHQWDELAEWLRAEASDLRDADAVERAVIAWERSGRHDDWLLDGARLAGAETLKCTAGFRGPPQPGRRVPARVTAAGQRKAVNGEGRSGSPRALAAAALTGAGGAACRDRRCRGLSPSSVSAAAQSAERQANEQARQAIAAKLAVESRAMLGGARQGGDRRAIQQMLAAETLAPGSRPGALLDTLDDERRLMKVIATPSNVNSLAVSPDGRQISFGRSGSYDPPLGSRIRQRDRGAVGWAHGQRGGGCCEQ